MLYSSTDAPPEAADDVADSNTYQPFKSVDAGVMKSILAQVDSTEITEQEGTLCIQVHALQNLCFTCQLHVLSSEL